MIDNAMIDGQAHNLYVMSQQLYQKAIAAVNRVKLNFSKSNDIWSI